MKEQKAVGSKQKAEKALVSLTVLLTDSYLLPSICFLPSAFCLLPT